MIASRHWLRLSFLISIFAFLFAGDSFSSRADLPPLPVMVATMQVENGEFQHDYDLQVVDARTGDTLYSVSTPQYDCPVNLSPDQQWAVYEQIDLDTTVYLHNLATDTTLTLPDQDIHEIQWAPNSQQLAYLIQYHDQPSVIAYVFTYDVATQERDVLMNLPVLAYRFVNGLWMVAIYSYPTPVVEYGDQSYEIGYPMDRQSYNVSISPDGLYVAYNVSRDHNSYLYVSSVQTGRGRLVSRTPATPFEWSPDSKNILYLTDEYGSAIYLYNVYNQTVQQRIELPEYADYIDGTYFSPDGHYLVYVTYTAGGTELPISTIYLLDLQSGLQQQVEWSYASWKHVEIEWVTPTLFVYTHMQATAMNAEWNTPWDLWLYDVTTQTKTQLTDTPDVDESLGCTLG